MTTYAIAWRSRRGRPQRVVTEALAGLLVAAGAGALTLYGGGQETLKGVAVLIVVAGSVWFATTRRVALALALLMLYLGLLDGYLKLATGSSYVTFVRDVLLFALAVGVLLRASAEGRRLALPPLSGWAIAFVVIVLVELANPGNGTLYHSVAGARQHLEFVPLFFLTFAFVRTVAALRAFAILMVVIAFANGLANVVQFHESPQQLAAWGPGYSQRVLGTQQFGNAGRTFFNNTGQQATRPFGLGSDSGDGGLMAAFALGSILALASIPRRKRYVGLAAIGAVAAVAGIITAQGRAVLVCGVVVLVAYAVLAATSRRGFVTVLAVTLLGLVTLFTVRAVLGGSSSTLRYSSLRISNIFQTAVNGRGATIAVIPQYAHRYPLGAGLGVAGPAAGVSGAPAQTNLDAESEFTFAILETGIPGAAALIGFTLAILLLALKRCGSEPDPEARVLLAAIIAPVAGMLVLYAVSALTPTTPGGPYLWAVGGIAAYWLVARPAQLRTGSVAASKGA
jgi:hypothetical protein